MIELSLCAAGHGWAGTLGPQEAVRIFTGAPLPIGADAVIYQELEALEQAVQSLNRELNVFEASCFSGCYITGDINEAYLDAIEAARKKGKAANEALFEEDSPSSIIHWSLFGYHQL